MKKFLILCLLAFSSSVMAEDHVIKVCRENAVMNLFLNENETFSLIDNYKEGDQEIISRFSGKIVRSMLPIEIDYLYANEFINEVLPGTKFNDGVMFNVNETETLNKDMTLFVFEDQNKTIHLLIGQKAPTFVVFDMYAGNSSACK